MEGNHRPPPGPLYRFEGFQVLRGMMYLITAALFGLAVVAGAGFYGWGPLATG